MGIVLKQSAANTVVTYIGFAIGAVNTLFLYTTILGKKDYGIVGFILSGGALMMPILAFGVHNTLVRFFSRYKTEAERETFLSFMLVLPLVVILPLGLFCLLGSDFIVHNLMARNPTAQPFLWTIPAIGLFMAYFEIFYAWAKVHMKSVFGNLISEVLVRVLVMAGLFGVSYGWLTKAEFIELLVVIYGCQWLAMMLFALSIKKPVLRFERPKNLKELSVYSLTTILSGGIAVLLVELDKVLLGMYGLNESNGIYNIAIFISTVIAVPSRSMLQIIAPITAKLMSEEKYDELNALYKKSAITLQYFGGAILLLIFLNIEQMYRLIPGNYEAGTIAIFLLGVSKFYDVMLGNNNAIILNTKYFRSVLGFGVLLVVLMIVLNMIFIPMYDFTGSALATLLSVMCYNTVKLWFVVRKTGLYPFTVKTLWSLGIIGLLFVLFFFWDFGFHPIVNIVLKSALVLPLYVALNYVLKISPDVNDLFGKILGRVGYKRA
ncbi:MULTISPECIES: lipopolysaccharide biosynthesis protein [unclassified Flavobacterium]|uniref:lipopolysaccharide biosynthesis protein n=1 Tax=unclassified Flavobacterium TaxID=196869 RepID=UPI001F141D6E|nr:MULTISPECIES: oligosaccharide flippase family protein [unclassified Flavobacterium]UMY64998.1 oligosaccharide flippase family protein [Flavobacterium sp. HJ-32-4]